MRGNKFSAATNSSSVESANRSPDSRREPRVSYRIPLLINDIEVPSSNISVTGAQVCCPTMRYRALYSTATKVLPVSWTVPGTSYHIHCAASLRYSNLCEDEYLIGLEFSAFTADALEKWRDFVNALIAKRELNEH